ncbi:MAG: MATE family efflux transporter [Lachnospiraceae bacterium]|nr:MATE family efflux transporter [Lachnospiraceae bacterium]
MKHPVGKHYEMDMTSGSLLPKILTFAIPLMISGILQLLFNAADIVIAGRFAASADRAIAAVGSTSSIVNLLVSLFIGMSVGVNVLAARFFATKQVKEMQETVHTAVALSLAGGIIMILVGELLCHQILVWVDSPEDVIGLSTIYLRIYFLGMPMTLLYNFGNAIHQAIGDTRTPLLCLSLAGIINVTLNLLFVIVFHMDVAGVALATILSQTISAIMLARSLINGEEIYRLDIKKIRFYPDKLKRILQFGIPAGLQSAVFSISNVLIQSSVNSFGSVVMAGNAAAANLEGFVYIAMNSIYQTCISFVGQNYGVKNFKRINTVLYTCLATVTVIGLVLGILFNLGGPLLLSIYTTRQETIRYGMTRLLYISLPYCICGCMDTICGAVRGMGRSILPMIVSLFGSCVFRVIWVLAVFPQFRSIETLYISYPISWAMTALLHYLCFRLILRGVMQREQQTA